MPQPRTRAAASIRAGGGVGEPASTLSTRLRETCNRSASCCWLRPRALRTVARLRPMLPGDAVAAGGDTGPVCAHQPTGRTVEMPSGDLLRLAVPLMRGRRDLGGSCAAREVGELPIESPNGGGVGPGVQVAAYAIHILKVRLNLQVS